MQSKKDIPTPIEFFIKLPLYEKVEFDKNNEHKILEFLTQLSHINSIK